MLTKHPQAPPPSLPSDPVPPPMDLSESIVSRCVMSFPCGSAPGPSGFRASHLREAVLCPSPSLASQTISILTSFVNLHAKGCTPPSVIPHLCGASLLACHKKNGGLRPIGPPSFCEGLSQSSVKSEDYPWVFAGHGRLPNGDCSPQVLSCIS